MKEKTIVHAIAKTFKLKLSGVVCMITTGFAACHYFVIKPVVINRVLAKHRLTSWTCLPIELLGWNAIVAGYIISLASSNMFAQKTTGLLGKRADGSMDPVLYALGGTYQIGLQTKLYLERRQDSEAPFDMVAEGLYLGGWPANVHLLPGEDSGKGATPFKLAVVDVTCELPCRVRHAVDAYLPVLVWDSHAPSVDQVQGAVAWALARRETGHSIYVHCAHGHGRSATVVGAILIAMGRARGVDEAVDIMKKARPLVRLNSRQHGALVAWDQRYGSKVK
jgi:hypothetical protein